MELPSELKRKLKRRFSDLEEMYIRIFNNFLVDIEQCKSVENFMLYKKKLLLELIEKLPLTEDYCPFCISNYYITKEGQCEDCEYGKIHGKCIDANSDWMKIWRAKIELMRLIDEHYYSNEEYKGW